MPTLDWIGKKAVVNHHREVPYRLVHCDGEKSAGDPDAGNLLVQGDNLEALKALLPYYAGKVKCIYIDPPYNTGKEGWIYNDNVNSPEIKRWLGDVVGKEAEDLSRHDKWLCMIYPRIRLLKEFLAEDGVIFVSIDDNEIDNLAFVMDEVFGKQNWVGTIVWKNVTDNNPSQIVVEHEYIYCAARRKSSLDTVWKSPVSDVKELLVEKGRELSEAYPDEDDMQQAFKAWYKEQKAYLSPLDRYKYIDRGGIFTGSQSVHNPGREGYRYDILHPETGLPTKQPAMGYRFPEATARQMEQDKRFIFGKDENKIVEIKLYAAEYEDKLPSIISMDGRLGSNEISSIFYDRKKAFDYPKPTALIKQLLSYVLEEGDLVLDSFAGSGTTGQAILELNKESELSASFILVEMDDTIASTVTAERLRRVSTGYDKSGDPEKHIEGLGGGFRYCTLGTPLFNEFGDIDAGVTFPDLAAHIFFSETGSPIPEKADPASAFLGCHRDKAIYLLFSPAEQGFAREASGNVLTPDALASLPAPPDGFEGQRIVLAEGCTVTKERLKAERVTFKQIPYQIEAS